MSLLQRCAVLVRRSFVYACWHILWPPLKTGFTVFGAICLSVLLWLFIGLSVTLYVSGPTWIPTSTQWLLLLLVAAPGLFVFWLLFGWLAWLMRRNLAAARQHPQVVALRRRLYREEFLLDDPAED